jgi:hypothetical protein
MQHSGIFQLLGALVLVCTGLLVGWAGCAGGELAGW